MNESTQLNSELLSADARGRKHIPVAVFAVILVHVVLFVVLLIAAGCRSSARVKKMNSLAPQVAQTQPAIQPAGAAVAPSETRPDRAAVEPIQAGEPIVEVEQARARSPVRELAQQAAPGVGRSAPPTARNTSAAKPRFYIVKSGDTLGQIAKQHGTTIQAVRAANNIKSDLIFPGQKLRVAPATSAEAPFQARSEKKKRSNEA